MAKDILYKKTHTINISIACKLATDISIIIAPVL